MYGDPKFVLPLTISCLALVVSLLTFYYSQWRGARIHIVAGEVLYIGHFDDGNCHIAVSIACINDGARPGTVKRFALLVKGPGSVDGYLLEPYMYQMVLDNGKFAHESMPVPIVLGARETLMKQVLFRSSQDRPKDFQVITPGTFKLTLLGWVRSHDQPDIANSLIVELSQEAASRLKTNLANMHQSSERVIQTVWRKWAARAVKEVELRALHPQRSVKT